MKHNKEKFLKLVWNLDSKKVIKKESESKYRPSLQVEMFAESKSNSILVIYLSDMDGKLFSNTIKNIHPSYILDMRPNPRFDIAGYSRKLAFSEFDDIGSVYMDYIKLVGSRNKNKEQLISAAEKILKNKKHGTIAFLFGKKEQDEIYEKELLDNLTINKNEWSLVVVP